MVLPGLAGAQNSWKSCLYVFFYRTGSSYIILSAGPGCFVGGYSIITRLLIRHQVKFAVNVCYNDRRRMHYIGILSTQLYAHGYRSCWYLDHICHYVVCQPFRMTNVVNSTANCSNAVMTCKNWDINCTTRMDTSKGHLRAMIKRKNTLQTMTNGILDES